MSDPESRAEPERDGRAAGQPSLAELERMLRREPWDAATSQVWADALSAAGDPRGELVALEHAVRAASPEAAVALAARQCELWDDHEEALAGQPGGFPFRDPYVGRRVIRCYVQQEPRGDWGDLLERGRRFVDRFTNAAAPALVCSYALDNTTSLWDFGRPIEPESDIERELVARLAPAALHHVTNERRYVKRADPLAPDVDTDALLALLRGLAPITVRWTFSMTAPGTTTLLPYQEGWIYGRSESLLGCALQVTTTAPAGHESALGLVFDAYLPFDGFDEPGFDDYLTDVFATLGAEPPSRGIWLLEPQPAPSPGPRLIAERIRHRDARR
jgi:hypothetical protein